MESPSLDDAVLTSEQLQANTLSEALQILALIRDGKTVEQAAAALGLSRSTAFRRLSLIEDDSERGVVKLLSAKALDFAEDWIKASTKAADKGDHRPAMHALQSIKVIEPIGDSAARTSVAIIIGTPDQPLRIASPQVIDTAALSE